MPAPQPPLSQGLGYNLTAFLGQGSSLCLARSFFLEPEGGILQKWAAMAYVKVVKSSAYYSRYQVRPPDAPVLHNDNAYFITDVFDFLPQVKYRRRRQVRSSRGLMAVVDLLLSCATAQ